MTADLTGWSAPTAAALAAGIDGLEHHVGELTLGPPRPGALRYSWEANETELTALANEMASRGATLTVTSGLFQEGFLADSFPSAKPTFLALPPGMPRRAPRPGGWVPTASG